MPTIKLEKFRRDCPYNDQVDAGESEGQLIHDFRVLIDGEHRATFNKYDRKRLYYTLRAPYVGRYDTISGKEEYRQHEVKGVKNMIPYVEEMLAKGAIPTLAEFAARDVQFKANEKVKAEETTAKARIALIRHHAPELFDALSVIVKTPAIRNFLDLNDPKALVQVVEALEKADPTIKDEIPEVILGISAVRESK